MKSTAIIALLLLISLTGGITSPAQANQPADEILYSQDFNSGSAGEWDISPGWSIIPSENGYALQGKGHVWAELRNNSWEDYYLQFRVNLQAKAILHANIRKSGASRYFIGLGHNSSYISRQDDENIFHNQLAKGAGIAPGWHTIRISANQGMVEVLSDGKKLMTYSDPNPLTMGGVAFENLNEEATLVDDVLIGTGTPTAASVSATGLPPSTDLDALQQAQPTQPASPSSNLNWTYTGGPLGGLGYDVRMSPDNPDVMYITDAKAGVFKSTDGGKFWKAINNGITTRTGETNDVIPIFCLTISETNPNLIWVGTKGQRGAFKSTDAGKTWKKMDKGISYPTLTLRGFAIDPKDNNIVYSAGEVSSWEWSGSDKPGKEFDKVKGVVYKTTNGGQSWKEVWKGNNLGRYILIDPRNSNVLYLSTGIFDREAADSDWKTNQPGGEGILKSTDGGQTWNRINSGLGNLYVGSLFMHPTNPDILLAGTGNNTFNQGSGVYITKDGGGHWQQTFKGDQINSVEISTADPNIAYAGNGANMFRSEDGGMTWQLVSPPEKGWGPPGLSGGQPIDFQADPRNPRRVFANVYGGGNFLSEDGGRSWIDASHGYTGSMIRDIIVDPSAPGHVYAVARSGFFESRNGGSTWETPELSFSTGDNHTLAMDPSNPAHLVLEINCMRILANSTDGGHTFTSTYNTSEQHGWRALAFAPSDPSIIYAGSAGFLSCGQFDYGHDAIGFLRSSDGGLTWVSANDASTNHTAVYQIAVHPQDPQTIYAGTMMNGLLKSTDGGKTWPMIGVSTFPKTASVSSVEISPWENNTIFAGKRQGGLWISMDAGVSWKRSSTGLNPEATVSDIVFDPIQQQVIYLADLFSGVYRSQDSGKTWQKINNGLLNRAVNKLAISADGLHLYAASEGMGVFRLDLNGQPPPTIPERKAEPISSPSTGVQLVTDTERSTGKVGSIPIVQPDIGPGEENPSADQTVQSAAAGNTLLPRNSAIPVCLVIGVSLWSVLRKKKVQR